MIYDCVVIGSGVAGLTAALYLGRANKKVLVIENSTIGGTTAELDIIENFPSISKISGKELISNFAMQVLNLGINIDMCDIKHLDFDNKHLIVNNNKIEYRTLIIASGMSVNKLNLDNEDKFKLKGLSYCAICDGALYKNKKIAIVTKGNIGMSSYQYLSGITKDIMVIDMLDKFKYKNENYYSNCNVRNLLGDHCISGIEFESNGNNYILDCDAIFVSLGKSTDLSLYIDRIDTEDGYILSDENMKTNVDGVFVAGDIRKKSLKQIITACSDGAIAANEVIKYLTKYKF